MANFEVFCWNFSSSTNPEFGRSAKLNMCPSQTGRLRDFDSFNEQKKVVPLKASVLSVEKLFTTLPIKCFDHSQKPLNYSAPPIESELG